MNNSVHLENFPIIDGSFIEDKKLISSMDKVRAICSCVLFVRDKNNLRVRLPLNKITIISNNNEELKEFSEIILDEVNIKNIDFVDNVDDYADKKLTLNFPKIGSKVGSKMNNLIKASKNNEWEIRNDKLLIENFELVGEEFKVILQPKKSNVFTVNNFDILIMLDLNITQDLEEEGIARDLVRKIQQLRKDAKLNISDKINILLETDDDLLKNSISKFENYIKNETLSQNIVENDVDFCFNEKIDNKDIKIGFTKIG